MEGDPMTKIIAAQDLFTDSDGTVVGAGPAATMLVARKGRPVPERFADGVTPKGNPKTAAPSKKSRKQPMEDKSATPPKEK